jgi:tetratricopeptide (TPR) repeat protein
LLFKGDFAKAGTALESLQELSLSPSAGPLAQLTARHSEAMYYVTKGLKNKCLNSVSKGLELSFKTGVHALDRWFYGMAATSALDQEDSAEAEEWIKKMASTQDRPKSWDDAFYHVSKARQALLKNEYQKASYHAELSLESNTNVGAPFFVGISCLLNALVQHELGDYLQASKHLEHASMLADQTGSMWIRFLLMLLEAHFAFDRGDDITGLSALRKAFALGKKHEHIYTVVIRPTNSRQALCQSAGGRYRSRLCPPAYPPEKADP